MTQLARSTSAYLLENTSFGVHDMRCRRGLEDPLQCVVEVDFEYDNVVLHAITMHHRDFDCLEIIIFPSTVNTCESELPDPWGRYYLSAEIFFQSIDKRDFDQAFETEKTSCQQRRRRFSVVHLQRNAKYRAAKPILQQMFADVINLDISRRFLEQQKVTSEVLFDPIGRPLEFRSYSSQSVSFQIPKPTCLVPTNLSVSSMKSAYQEYQKYMKLKMLFNLSAKRLFCTWARYFSDSRFKPHMQTEFPTVRLPNLFPSHRIASSSQTAPRDGAHEHQQGLEKSYIGTRVSVFLNEAGRPTLNTSSSGKVNIRYKRSLILPAPTNMLCQDSTIYSNYVSIARVRWIVAIDRTLRSLMHRRIVARLKEIEDKRIAEGSSGNVKGLTRLQMFRSRVLAVSALTRMKQPGAQLSKSSPSSPQTPLSRASSGVKSANISHTNSPRSLSPLPTRPIMNAGKLNMVSNGRLSPLTLSSTSSAALRTVSTTPTSVSLSSTSAASLRTVSTNASNCDTASPENISPKSLDVSMHPPHYHFYPDVLQQQSSGDSSAAIQQLRGAWLLHRLAQE